MSLPSLACDVQISSAQYPNQILSCYLNTPYMTPEGRICVRTFKCKGIMILHIYFQNEPELVTQDQELEDEKLQIAFNPHQVGV